MRLEPAIYSQEEFAKSLERARKLAATETGSGHQTFLSGIRVSFDLIYPNYISPELQRYHWIDIVTSSSKMQTLSKMADDPDRYNKYVNQASLDNMKALMDEFNRAESADERYEAFMRLVSNCPQGIELFMRVSTNYLQLKTIYAQRKNHKLKEDWVEGFCENFIEKLPYSELITGNNC